MLAMKIRSAAPGRPRASATPDVPPHPSLRRRARPARAAARRRRHHGTERCHGPGLQRHDGAGRVPDDDDRSGELRGQGQHVVSLAGHVGGRVGRQLGAVEPAAYPHHAEARRELRGDIGPSGLVAEPAVDDEDHGTAPLVRVDDPGRVVGGEVLQHVGHATDAAHLVRRMSGWPSPCACSSTAGPTGWSVQLWERLEAQGVATLLTHTHGRHHPHLSYAVLRDGDPDTVLAALPPDASGGAVEVTAQGSVVFPRGRVALACAVPADVVLRQERVVGRTACGGAGASSQLRAGPVGPARLGRDQRGCRPGPAGGRCGVGRAATPAARRPSGGHRHGDGAAVGPARTPVTVGPSRYAPGHGGVRTRRPAWLPAPRRRPARRPLRGSTCAASACAGVWLEDVDITGDIREPPHQRRRRRARSSRPSSTGATPTGPKMRPTDPAGFREAWDVVERLWAGTVERARALRPRAAARVGRRRVVVHRDAAPPRVRHRRLGPPGDPRRPRAVGPAGPALGRDARHARACRATATSGRRSTRCSRCAATGWRTVRQVVDGLTDESLAGETEPVEGPAGRGRELSRCAMPAAVLNEEWQHRLYAERDLDALEACGR